MKSYLDEIAPLEQRKAGGGASKLMIAVIMILQLANGVGTCYVYSLTEIGSGSRVALILNKVVSFNSPSPTKSTENQTEQIQKQEQGQTSEEAMKNLVTLLQRIQAERIEKAMHESRVINGMSAYDVKLIWGSPDEILNGTKLGDDSRKRGIFEQWWYLNKSKVINFNRDGIVFLGDNL